MQYIYIARITFTTISSSDKEVFELFNSETCEGVLFFRGRKCRYNVDSPKKHKYEPIENGGACLINPNNILYIEILEEACVDNPCEVDESDLINIARDING